MTSLKDLACSEVNAFFQKIESVIADREDVEGWRGDTLLLSEWYG